MTTPPPPGFDPPQGEPNGPPQPAAPNPKKKRPIWLWVLGAAAALGVVGALTTGPGDKGTSSAPASTPAADAAVGCAEAPVEIVEIINANFTNGKRLENTQSVSGPSGKVIVGGNIVASDGTRVSSLDSWVMSDGEVYGLSGDARRLTRFGDGRDVLGGDWATYNHTVGECVLQKSLRPR